MAVEFVDYRELFTKSLLGGWVFGDLPDGALSALLSIIKQTQAENIFEFGTFRGRTTLNIAVNLPDDAKIYTLDLPSDAVGSHSEFEDLYMSDELRRELLVGIPKRTLNKIEIIQDNSMCLNFERFYNKMDIVFVDGGHTLDVIQSDSMNAIKMVRVGGYVIWDDYANSYCPDVNTFINSFAENNTVYFDTEINLVIYKHEETGA